MDQFTLDETTSIRGQLADGLSVGETVMKESLMSKKAHAAVAVIAATLLMGAFAVAAVAQQQQPARPGAYDEGGPTTAPRMPEPMITLTGMLQSDGAGGFMLLDQASGESITLLKKTKKLAAHDQSNVTVIGRWKKGDESTKTFKVSKVEPAAAPAEPVESAAPATAPESPSTPQTTPSTPQEPAAPATPATPAQPAVPENPEAPDQQPLPNAPEAPAPGTP